MVSWNPNADKWVKTVNDVALYYREGNCKSSDTKPVSGIANGSKLIEMDTATLWSFDEDTGTWIEWGGQ